MLNSQQFLFVNHYRKIFEIVITIKIRFIAQMILQFSSNNLEKKVFWRTIALVNER